MLCEEKIPMQSPSEKLAVRPEESPDRQLKLPLAESTPHTLEKRNEKRIRALEAERRYRARNREELNARMRLWRRLNPRLHKQRCAASRRKKPELYRASDRAYYHAHKAKRKEQQRQSLVRNPERPRRYQRDYRKQHGDKVRAYMNRYLVAWRAKQRATNPLFLLTDRLRARLKGALIEGNSKKSASTMALLGCSIEHFRTHIESLFLPGMTWDNRHLWHLDHKTPIIAFDITKPEGQQKAFHWTNIQPLWSEDNRRKSDKLPCGRSARKAC